MDAEHNFVNRGQAGRVDYTPKNSSIRKMHSDEEYFKSNAYYDPKHISVLSPLELKYYAVE